MEATVKIRVTNGPLSMDIVIEKVPNWNPFPLIIWKMLTVARVIMVGRICHLAWEHERHTWGDAWIPEVRLKVPGRQVSEERARLQMTDS